MTVQEVLTALAALRARIAAIDERQDARKRAILAAPTPKPQPRPRPTPIMQPLPPIIFYPGTAPLWVSMAPAIDEAA